MVVSEGTNEFYDSDISANDDLIEYTKKPMSLKWETYTIQLAGELTRNPRDSRRTRSHLESAVSVKDIFFVDKYFIMHESDPNTYEDACEDPKCQTTMKEEFHSLQKNDTWDLVILSPWRKLFKCKWVLKTKFYFDGSLMKYKSRLLAKEFSQFQGIDYNDTFAPDAKMDSIRLVLAIASSKQWEVHHMDVKSVFLHADMKG